MTLLHPVKLLVAASRARMRLRTYEPKKVTIKSVRRWAQQFPKDIRVDLVNLAADLIFISKKQVSTWLVMLNEDILSSLESDDIQINGVIYVTTDTAGSSSSVMLNLLRNRANLERRNAIFLDHKDVLTIHRTTMRLGRGAIVYVDDFAGTGNQFMRSRRNVRQYVAGTFSEYLLLSCVCEEAKRKIEKAGVEIQSWLVHKKAERPLSGFSTLLDEQKRERILQVSQNIWGPRKAMGYRRLATNVIIYHNSPNSTPLVFRGDLYQAPYFGIVPRFDDLPIPQRSTV